MDFISGLVIEIVDDSDNDVIDDTNATMKTKHCRKTNFHLRRTNIAARLPITPMLATIGRQT